MKAKAYLVVVLLIFWGIFFAEHANSQVLSPYKDYAMTTIPPARNADGTTKRDAKVVREYRKLYACPSTHKFTGACPGCP